MRGGVSGRAGRNLGEGMAGAGDVVGSAKWGARRGEVTKVGGRNELRKVYFSIGCSDIYAKVGYKITKMA